MKLVVIIPIATLLSHIIVELLVVIIGGIIIPIKLIVTMDP